MASVFGRDVELEAALAVLGSGTRPAVAAVIEGEPGIGKSTVWAAALQRLDVDRLVLTARPASSEVRLDLATLADLLETVPATVIEALPLPQRLAVDAVLLRRSPSQRELEPRVLGTALRSILVTAAAERAVVLAIDDLQWIDAASATVLGYALRRLGDEPVAILGARRTSEASPLDLEAVLGLPRVRHIRLGPLTIGALHHVLRAHRGASVPRSTLVRVHQASRGVPLFALEVLRLLDETGIPPVGQPLAVPQDLRSVVARRVSRLPASAREVLLAMALADQPSAKAIETALVRPIARDVELIVRRGFATAGDDRLELGHPLFGAAVESLASADERRQAHARLATSAASDEARARHLALATDGPSAAVAAEVEAAAARAVTRAGPAAAAALLELSIERTPPAEADTAARRRVVLARYLQRAGDATSAQGVLDAVLAATPGPRVRAQARLALAALRYELDAAAAITRLAQAALDDAAGDPELTAYGHALVAAVSWEDFRARDAHADEAVRWLARVANPDPMVEALVLMQRCETDAAAGRPLDRGLVVRGLRLERRAAMGPVSERFGAALGVWLKYRDDFGGARRWLERTLRAAEDEGDDGSLPYALSHLPQLELWTGRWAEAEAYARRHLEVAVELGLEAQRRQALYNLALVHAHQGRETEARAEISDGLAAAAQDGDAWTEASLLPLLGLLELSLDRPAAAVGPLRRATELRDQIGQDAPRRHDADLVESLVATGDIQAASAIAEAAEARARRYGTHTAIANALRAKALVSGATGDLDGAVTWLEDALCEHALAPIPFDRARTLVSLGLVRRRRRDRTAARDALAEALAVYESLGASQFVERTRAELDRVGLRRSAGTDLTETERRVAELAARGLTNREVAAAMFVSPKTVEANLARAYHKLGVASRAELGALLGATVAPGTSPRSTRSVHS